MCLKCYSKSSILCFGGVVIMYMLFISQDTHKLYAIKEQESPSKIKSNDLILGIYDSPSEVPLLLDNFLEENPEVTLNDTQVDYK